MESLQESTKAPAKNEKDNDPLWSQKLMFIDYKAVGGWITDPDKNIPEKMTMDTFARQIGVDRTSLYNWQKSIPDFWDKVAERRKELGSHERLVKVHDSWYLKALSGSFPHMQLWLANFDSDFRMPTEKMQVEAVNSWAALMAKKRKQEAIEGEVVDAETSSAE